MGGGDFWMCVRLTPGLSDRGGEVTTICEPVRMPLASRAEKYVNGISMFTTSIRRIPSECVPARAKLHSYVNSILADQEAQAKDPHALALMQDMRGNIAEGSTYNFFCLKGD